MSLKEVTELYDENDQLGGVLSNEQYKEVIDMIKKNPEIEYETVNDTLRTKFKTTIELYEYSSIIDLLQIKKSSEDIINILKVLNRKIEKARDDYSKKVGIENTTEEGYAEATAKAIDNTLAILLKVNYEKLKNIANNIKNAYKTKKAAATKIKNAIRGNKSRKDDFYYFWVEPTTDGKKIEYKPIDCDSNEVLGDKDKCVSFLTEFINGDLNKKREYIKAISKNEKTLPDIKHFEKLDPNIIISFLKQLNFKKIKYLDDKFQQILYKVQSYDDWLKTIVGEEAKKTYATNVSFKVFVKKLINILNSNPDFLNTNVKKGDEKSSTTYAKKHSDQSSEDLLAKGKADGELTVPEYWKDRGLRQIDTDNWYISFIDKVKNDWEKEKEEFKKYNVNGKPVNLVNDGPREGIATILDLLSGVQYPFIGGSNINLLLKSKWENINNKLYEKGLKLMGNVDVEEKIKEYGNINAQKEELLKIMSDYNKFANSNNLDPSNDVSVLTGGFQQLINKEEETLEFLNKKMFAINKLLDLIETSAKF
jgi:hypothetical protein